MMKFFNFQSFKKRKPKRKRKWGSPPKLMESITNKETFNLVKLKNQKPKKN